MVSRNCIRPLSSRQCFLCVLFTVTSSIEGIEAAQQIHTILVVAGTTADKPIVECWDVLTGQLVSVAHPIVSLANPHEPEKTPERYAGEWEGASLPADKVYPSIMDNGDVVYWQKGEQSFERFSFPAIEQHLEIPKS